MRLLFYPELPKKPSKMVKLLELSGIEATNHLSDSFDKVIYWSYHKTKLAPDDILIELNERYNVINKGGIDITKSRVEAVQMAVFGYNSIIDPFNYDDKIVEKSEKQCGHDFHKVIDKVDKKKKGYIYCKLLDDRYDEEHFRYYRYYVYGNKITHTSVFIMPDKYRFKGGLKGERVTYPGVFGLSDADVDKVIEYCAEFGTPLTELDVIRDDGKIYIIDVNNIPGAIIGYEKELYNQWADAFKELIEQW